MRVDDQGYTRIDPQLGKPVTIGRGQDLNTGNSNVRPDRISSGEIDNPTRALW